MLFEHFINELASDFGKGITFIDIDETIFHTFAKIKVLKDGKLVRELDNQEFNTYVLKDGEQYDFGQFRSADLFARTSIPIPQTVKRIQRMFKNIDRRESRIVLLTARGNFDNKEEFLQVFRKNGIPIDKIYVERAGEQLVGTLAQTKAAIINKYLKTGEYRRVRLIDDDLKNVKTFLEMEKTLDPKIIEKIKKKHKITGDETIKPLEFYGLLAMPNGHLKRL